MSNLAVNAITDASGGTTASINGYTPSASNMAGRNRVINGAMMIDQRNAGASVTPTDGQYVLDRWKQFQSVASKYSVQRNAGSVTPPAGFINYLGATSLSAYSVGTSDYFAIIQEIEGFNTADFAWGTASAATITVSFWVRSSLTGTFGGVIGNGSNTRGYPFTYTISSANTWEQKSITIPGDTTGTWGTDNGSGLRLKLGLGVGSTLSGTAGSWQASNLVSATGATSVVGTSGATFYLTGVQLEVGSTASEFEHRQYGQELALCQRYCYVGARYGVSGYGGTDYLVYGAYVPASNWLWARAVFPVRMRATPTVSIADGAGTFGKQSLFTSAGGAATHGVTPYSIYPSAVAVDMSDYNNAKYGIYGNVKAEAEL